VIRAVVLALAVLALTGCAGMKIGMGYNMQARQFFLQLEKPLEPSLKK
jgi:cytosine/uracil/thiamine/allantoin permease